MPPIARVPRWIVENDPTWEKSTDSDPAVLRWNKKGTNVQAISYPASICCDITRQVPDEAGLSDVFSNLVNYTEPDVLAGGDIARYLSSRYLNPRMNRPSDLDTKF
ncbi:MAG: hypothetical protein ACJ702_03965 [Nitrososphaeraceae archaeon]